MSVSATPGEKQVAIVDDHVLFAQTLELALSREGFETTRIDLPDSARSGTATLLRALLDLAPAIVLLDLDLGVAGDGYPLIEPMTNAGIDVVVLTGAEEPGQWARALMTGARKVVSKSSPLEQVLTTVHRLATGQPVLRRGERQELLDAWVAQRAGKEALWSRFDLLTLRESQVLGLLMQGRAVREIARQGDTAEGTVRTQVKSVLGKLQVSSQLAAVGLAYEIGWHPPFERRSPLRS